MTGFRAVRRAERPARTGLSRRNMLLALLALPVLGVMPVRRRRDPAEVIYAQWQEACREADLLARESARIERALAARIGYPEIQFRLASGGIVHIHDRAGIDRLPEDALAQSERDDALVRLDDVRERWQRQATAYGLADALLREEAADRRVDALAQQAIGSRARTRSGVASKLRLALDQADPAVREDWSWLLVRSALRDLDVLG